MSGSAPATASFALDGLSPPIVIEPSAADEIATALREANERGRAVIPWGGGRHLSLGNLPKRYDVALRTTKLDRVIEYEPADLTITVQAGIAMGALQAHLAEHGQFLPIDAPVDATVGGVLAAGLSGPSAHAYGLPRDWLIGCRMALSDGTIIKGGGRVVKNVAGYDLPKLAVGSLGTLGVIVEASFKVAPLPPAQETVLAGFASLDQALAVIRAVNDRSLAIRANAILSLSKDEAGSLGAHTAALWLHGAASAVERTRRELSALLADAPAEQLQEDASNRWWTQIDGRDQPASGSTVLRTSLLPSHVAALLARLPAESEALAHPTTGIVIVRLDTSRAGNAVAIVQDLRRWVIERGGSLIVTRAPVAVKERIDVWGPSDALPLMRRLKEQFDPKGTLNPGRFVGGI
jgi:glycolate oxidase FAD binding subunit